MFKYVWRCCLILPFIGIIAGFGPVTSVPESDTPRGVAIIVVTRDELGLPHYAVKTNAPPEWGAQGELQFFNGKNWIPAQGGKHVGRPENRADSAYWITRTWRATHFPAAEMPHRYRVVLRHDAAVSPASY